MKHYNRVRESMKSLRGEYWWGNAVGELNPHRLRYRVQKDGKDTYKIIKVIDGYLPNRQQWKLATKTELATGLDHAGVVGFLSLLGIPVVRGGV